jgi:hypothetical protein
MGVRRSGGLVCGRRGCRQSGHGDAGWLAAHRLGHSGERADLRGQAGQHVIGGVHRLGGFPVGAQAGDVLFEGGQVGGVGPVEAAPGALEADRAGAAAGFDVGGLGAVAERHRHRCSLVGGRAGEWRGVAGGVGGQQADRADGLLLALEADLLWRSQVSQLSEFLSGPGVLGWLAAADVGGICGPVSGAGALPGDGDGDVDAEHAGEHGGGQFGGELEQGGRASPAGVDAEAAEPFGELLGADRASGLAAGEQPRRGALVADGRVAPSGGGQPQDQRVYWPGQGEGLAAELDAYLAVSGVEVAEGELADRRGCLGVEQDEQPGDAVLGLERVVVQPQPAAPATPCQAGKSSSASHATPPAHSSRP